MIEKLKKISNPLTVIGIFATLAEIAASVTILFLASELQKVFIWYVMLFPILLVVLFFITLNLNSKVLYAPSDFRTDESFLSLNQHLSEKQLLELSSNTKNLDDLPGDNILIPVVNHIDSRARQYLLKVVDKNLSFGEHWKIMHKLLFPNRSNKKSKRNLLESGHSLGYLSAFLINYINFLFVLKKVKNGEYKIILKMSSGLIQYIRNKEKND